MGTQNEPYAHVHHRIAEQVSRDTGVDVTVSDVAVVFSDDPKTDLSDEVVDAIVNEGREYGIA